MKHKLIIPKTKVVLFQPKLPGNFGNIVRTCSITNTDLSYVLPIPFSLNDKELKRAGIDYLHDIHLSAIPDFNSWLKIHGHECIFFSAHATQFIHSTNMTNRILVFGSETNGLPDDIMSRYQNQLVKIPMLPQKRCYNLSNSVAIGLYEQIMQHQSSRA